MLRKAVILSVVTLFATVTVAEARRPRGRQTPPRPAPLDAKAAKRLGEAYRAYRNADFEQALRLAVPLLRKRLRNRDYALYVAGQSAYLLGHRRRALGFFERLAKEKSSRFQRISEWRVADCLWDLGKKGEAQKEYARLARSSRAGDRALALYRLGDASLDAGEKEAAAETWKTLAREMPAHPRAEDAVARLAQIGFELSHEDRIARAEVLLSNRKWRESVAELEKIPDSAPEAARVERDFWIAQSYFKMRRRYDYAGKLFLSIFDKLDEKRRAYAFFHGARALSRADDDDAAIEKYHELVKRYPKSEWADEALYLAGWLELNRGNFRKGLPDLLRHRKMFPRSKFREDVEWNIAFSYFLLGEHEKALPIMTRLARRKGELDGGQGRYWKARTLDKLGKGDQAVREYRSLVTDYPLSWYALLSRERLAEKKIDIGVFGDREPDPERAPRIGPVDESLAAEPAIARADELLAAGLLDEAAYEIERAERSIRKKHGAQKALPILFDRYRKAKNYNRPWMLAEIYDGGALDMPPRGPARVWWEHAYPKAYQEIVEKVEGLGKNRPYWLYTLMRKETGFNPNTVSYANAIGLMQMIPRTTRKVAPELGLEYTDDFLFDPEKNLTVAAWYIGGLAQKFKYQIPIAMGSYNCGPRAMMKWLDKFGSHPVDEFVELATFKQTRKYMRLTASYYARYLYLYEGKELRIPFEVDADYVKNKLTY